MGLRGGLPEDTWVGAICRLYAGQSFVHQGRGVLYMVCAIQSTQVAFHFHQLPAHIVMCSIYDRHNDAFQGHPSIQLLSQSTKEAQNCTAPRLR